MSQAKPPKTAIVIPADGSQPARVETREWELEDLQAAVGGYIEAVDVHEVLTDSGRRQLESTMFVNEEGKLNGLPVNPRATDYAALAIGGWVRDVIVGDVVIIGCPDAEGETLTVPDEAVEIVLNWGWLE